jgi:hypothetical protein
LKPILLRCCAALVFCVATHGYAEDENRASASVNNVANATIKSGGSYETQTEDVRLQAMLEPGGSGAPGQPAAILMIETEDNDYLFALDAEQADYLRLSQQDIDAISADDAPPLLQWDSPLAAHAAVLNQVEVAPDKSHVRAKLTWRPHGSDFRTAELDGERRPVDDETRFYETRVLWATYSHNAALAHRTMRPVQISMERIEGGGSIIAKVYDNEAEASHKRWHAPLDQAGKTWSQFKNDLFAPFGLMFCGPHCFSG